jgi:hypothetical protein
VLYCGYSGTTLYFAGTITDESLTADLTYSSAGSIAAGDAVRLTLDGARDGLTFPVGGDDHDLYISPSWRVLDFDTQPISTTLALSAASGLWRFELALNASELGLTSLPSGTKAGLTWSLLDSDNGYGIEHVLTDRKRMLTIQ